MLRICGDNFVSDGEEFVFNSFIYLKSVKIYLTIEEARENLGALTCRAKEF